MAKGTLIQARIERALKKEVDKILDELGVSTNEVIHALYAQIKLRRSIPFDVQVSATDTITEISLLKNIEGFGDLICIAFEDGTWIKTPVAKFPKLNSSSEKQRENWKLKGGDIYWPDLDESISVQNFIDARLVPNKETRAVLERTKKGKRLSEAKDIEEVIDEMENW